METEDITEEFSALVEWLQTFNLQSEVTMKKKLKQLQSEDIPRTLFV